LWSPSPPRTKQGNFKNLEEVRAQNLPTFRCFQNLLPQDNDPTHVKKGSDGGVTLLVLEKKRIENVVLLEALVMEGEIGFSVTGFQCFCAQ